MDTPRRLKPYDDKPLPPVPVPVPRSDSSAGSSQDESFFPSNFPFRSPNDPLPDQIYLQPASFSSSNAQLTEPRAPFYSHPDTSFQSLRVLSHKRPSPRQTRLQGSKLPGNSTSSAASQRPAQRESDRPPIQARSPLRPQYHHHPTAPSSLPGPTHAAAAAELGLHLVPPALNVRRASEETRPVSHFSAYSDSDDESDDAEATARSSLMTYFRRSSSTNGGAGSTPAPSPPSARSLDNPNARLLGAASRPSVHLRRPSQQANDHLRSESADGRPLKKTFSSLIGLRRSMPDMRKARAEVDTAGPVKGDARSTKRNHESTPATKTKLSNRAAPKSRLGRMVNSIQRGTEMAMSAASKVGSNVVERRKERRRKVMKRSIRVISETEKAFHGRKGNWS
ncbi:MAG: hypothetical protein M1825_002820 [Sarcosagium campestre]|nr:MAG: hypothetical protein M1825_002820 [Sarcosagium campestre]